MDANTMASEFEIGYDVITSFGAPGYLDSEIGTILSIGQENLIKKKYTKEGNKYRKGFEGSEKRRKDLSELIKHTVVTTSASQVGVLPNGTFYDLPSDMLYTITEYAETDIVLCLKGIPQPGQFKQVPIIPVTHDEYNINIDNPFEQPSQDEIWRLDFESDTARRHELVTDGSFAVTTYAIRYIKQPVDIVVDRAIPANQVNSELDDSVHREIIQEAIRYAVSITKPNEYQIKQAEQQQSE